MMLEKNGSQKNIAHGELDMARPKKEKGNSLAPKAKSLFDHINHVREVQDPKYFDTLTDADKKSWSNYMVCRFLSMQPSLCEYINDIQVYQQVLAPREFYQLCIYITPKGRAFYPFIKNKSDNKYSEELMKILREYYQESERNVLKYLSIISRDELRNIISLYGYTEKEVETLMGG